VSGTDVHVGDQRVVEDGLVEVGEGGNKVQVGRSRVDDIGGSGIRGDLGSLGSKVADEVSGGLIESGGSTITGIVEGSDVVGAQSKGSRVETGEGLKTVVRGDLDVGWVPNTVGVTGDLAGHNGGAGTEGVEDAWDVVVLLPLDDNEDGPHEDHSREGNTGKGSVVTR